MFWDAGQARIGRERRVRLTEWFTASRDAALDVMVTTGQVKPVGTWKLPAYATADAPPAMRSPAIRDAALLKLGAMFPGMVRTDP